MKVAKRLTMLFNNGQAIPAVLRHTLLGLAAVALFGSGSDTSELVRLERAGATFPEQLYQCWFREYTTSTSTCA